MLMTTNPASKTSNVKFSVLYRNFVELPLNVLQCYLLIVAPIELFIDRPYISANFTSAHSLSLQSRDYGRTFLLYVDCQPHEAFLATKSTLKCNVTYNLILSTEAVIIRHISTSDQVAVFGMR